jgi:hypothetical protein
VIASGFLPRRHENSGRGGLEKTDGGKGRHEKWVNQTTGIVVIVPRSKSRHTANEVLKQAGLKKAF